MSFPVGPAGCCYCSLSYNPLVHAAPFADASAELLAQVEEELGYVPRSRLLCPAHANGLHQPRRPSISKRKTSVESDDEEDAKRFAIDSRSVASAEVSSASASASTPAAAASSSSASAAAASSSESVSTFPVDLSDPDVYSALCRAAHIPPHPPLDAADLLRLRERCIDSRVSFTSPDEYTARILQLMLTDDLQLFVNHPNFTKKERMPVVRTETDLSCLRGNIAENRLHVMARLELKKKDLQRCTNMPFQRTCNLLCELSLDHQLAGHALWYTQSVADGAPLHSDFVDNEQSCLAGRKAWVTVKYEEARAVGLDVVDVRDPIPKHSWADFLKCPSFRWFILAEGDTLFMPANRMHGTHALGNTLTCGIGHYLAHLPSLPHILRYWAVVPAFRPSSNELEVLVDCWLPHIKGADHAMRHAIQQARETSDCDSCRFSHGTALWKLQQALKQI